MNGQNKQCSRGTWEDVQQLLREERVGILSTYDGEYPYASVVAFVPREEGRVLHMVSSRSTRKYANLQRYPRGALLVDNRQKVLEDFYEASAITARGEVRFPQGEEAKRGKALFLERHPYLEEFVNSPNYGLIEMRVRLYVLVTCFQDVSEFVVSP